MIWTIAIPLGTLAYIAAHVFALALGTVAAFADAFQGSEPGEGS